MWNRLRWKIQSFMIGRNGMDELNRVLIYAAVCIDIAALVLSRFFPLPANILTWISYAVCIVFIYRAFSKKITMRRRENDRYKGFVSLWKLRISQRKEYRIYRCRGCGRNIRIPRGKGKIEVRCPACGNKTIHRT